MRVPRVRLNPLVLLAGALVLLGAGSVVEQRVAQRRMDLLDARAAYLAALSDTRTQLAGLLRKVTNDRALVQNIGWKLEHSVRATLDGKLQRGALDQLALKTEACADIASTGLGGAGAILTKLCPQATGGHERDGAFLWFGGDAHPALALVSAMSVLADAKEPAVYALGVVQLDAGWLGLHPELSAKMAALGLTIGTAPPAVQAALASGASLPVILAREGVDASGRAVAALETGHWLDGYLARQSLDERHDATRGSVWPCLFFALACTAWAWTREVRGRRAQVQLHTAFTDWCRLLGKGAPLPAPAPLALVATGRAVSAGLAPRSKPRVPLDEAKHLVGQAFAAKSEAVRALSAENAAFAADLQSRDAQLGRFRQRLAELAELDSLAIQLERTSATFLERMDRLHGQAEDLAESVGTGGLAGRGRELCAQLGQWQAGIAERGARKFLRGLSETPGVDAARTQLDEHLDALAVLAATVRDGALHAAIEARRLVDGSTFATRIAGFWRGLARRSADEPACADLAGLLGALESAQHLVRLEPAYAAVAFSSKLDAVDSCGASAGIGGDLLPAVPSSVWATALYHIYLALAELLPSAGGRSGVVIATRLRQDPDRGRHLLVVQIAAGGGDSASRAPLPQRAARQPFHLEIARSVLAPFDVGLAALPTLDGPFPIALSWATPPRAATDMSTTTAAGAGPTLALPLSAAPPPV